VTAVITISALVALLNVDWLSMIWAEFGECEVGGAWRVKCGLIDDCCTHLEESVIRYLTGDSVVNVHCSLPQ